MKYTFLIAIAILIVLFWIYNSPATVTSGTALVAPENIKRAMRKMGPLNRQQSKGKAT